MASRGAPKILDQPLLRLGPSPQVVTRLQGLDPPPWQARLAGWATVVASLAALGWWDVPGLVGVAILGTIISLAIWKRLTDSPDSFAAFAAKIVGIVGGAAIVIGGLLWILDLV